MSGPLWRRIALRHAPGLCLRWARLSTAELGELGEELAARWLARAGWRLLGRRVATPCAEIDVVGLHGSELVCVEVKTGRSLAVPRPRGVELPQDVELRWRPGARLDRSTLVRQRAAGRWLARRWEGGRLAGGRVDLIEVIVAGRPPRWKVRHHADLRQVLDGEPEGSSA